MGSSKHSFKGSYKGHHKGSRFYNGILQVVMRVPLMGYYTSIRVTISVAFGAPIGVVMSTRRV